MSKHKLQELAKFAAGLVAGDFMVGLWFYTGQLLPMDFWGLHITPEFALSWMIFDVILILLLIHFAWHINFPTPSIRQKNLYLLVGILLTLISAFHLLRLIFAVEVQFGTWVAPMWLSWLGTIVAGYLGLASLKFALGKK